MSDESPTSQAVSTANTAPQAREQTSPPYSLPPVMSSVVTEFLSRPSQVRALLRAQGSALNVLFPEQLSKNVQQFQSVFDQYRVRGQICFAHKCTRSDSLIRQLSGEQAWIDVASRTELAHALSCGFAASRIEATGPKNAQFLTLCLQHGVVINVDSLCEIEQLVRLRQRLALPVQTRTRILVRLSSPTAQDAPVLSKSSRFGIPRQHIEAVFKQLQLHGELQLLGFSFHLDTRSLEERIEAIEQCLLLTREAVDRGFSPDVINIGGGFRVNYLQKQEDWDELLCSLKASARGQCPPLTWRSNHFGLYTEDGELKGRFNSYNFFEPTPGARFLASILEAPMPSWQDRTVAEVLRDNMIKLWIEPGHALLDQCGLTVAQVTSLTVSSRGEEMVGLSIKRSDVSFDDQELMIDPIILYKHPPPEQAPRSMRIFFAGTLCRETDLIFRRVTFLPKKPEVGDLVAFINTAAYYMDFGTAADIMHPVPAKVAVVQENGNFIHFLDEVYDRFAWRFYEGD